MFLSGKSAENLRAMVGRFIEVYRRRGLKVNAGESKMMLAGEEGWCVRFSWSMCRNLNIWGVFWTNEVQMRQSTVGRCRMEGGLQPAGGIRSLVKAMGLQLECA